MPAHCHKLLAETAKAMAHELYDTMMLDNEWYQIWKRRNQGKGARALELAFVAKNWGRLVPNARATLAEMLGNPLLDPALAEQIYDALLLDSTLVRGRRQPPVIQQ
jgi:hypothetical protein